MNVASLKSTVVLIAVLCGGAVLGLIRALLAIPIAGTIHAVVSELLDERADRINAIAKPGQKNVPTCRNTLCG
jgi:predicted PurR-regulated permease PerM